MTPTLEKARQARRDKAEAEVWEKVRTHRKHFGCKCALRPGMSWADLLEFGTGCTAERGWICSTLDFYRLLVRGRR